MDYREIEVYGRKVRVYDETHIEMEYFKVKDNWRRVRLSGNKKGHPYYEITITNNGIGHVMKLHRLVFYAHNPSWDIYHNPRDNVIDHINNDCLDNRIENLRNITQQENNFNSKRKGYCWHKHQKKWIAQISVRKKGICLGYFDKEEDARDAYLTAKAKYHIIVAKTF